MAEYNPSKIIKDGNTYNFRDTTKIPLAGSNQISGSLIPATDNSIDVGSSTKNIKMLYTKGITINGTQFLPSDYIPRSGGGVFNGIEYSRNVDNSVLNFSGGTSWDTGAQLQLFGKNSSDPGAFTLYATLNPNTRSMLHGKPDGTLTWDGTVSTNSIEAYSVASKDTSNSTVLSLLGGNSYPNGAQINLYGNNHHQSNGSFEIVAHGNAHYLRGDASGTLTWDGQSIQTTSDQRFKQQISEIDDDLLTAWEDVDLVQFKYNDAVEQKGKDKARLHTGYVVQQIDSACKSHNVDISDYGLYCHEEYPEETEEVEVEQKDGTKTKERKVIREASEHYSLRYTEALIVECAYLRKKNKELQEQLNKLSARLDKLESASSK